MTYNCARCGRRLRRVDGEPRWIVSNWSLRRRDNPDGSSTPYWFHGPISRFCWPTEGCNKTKRRRRK